MIAKNDYYRIIELAYNADLTGSCNVLIAQYKDEKKSKSPIKLEVTTDCLTDYVQEGNHE